MTIKVRNTSDGGTELVLYGEVGWEIRGEPVIDALAQIDGGDLTVRLNSPGGDAYEGLAVMNALRSHAGEVTVIVEGLAASAASVIAVGGADRLVMRPQSEMMIHDAWAFVSGNAEELEKASDRLDAVSWMIAEVYAAKAGTDAEMWREAMRVETWFSADEAVSAGLADVVEDGRVEVGVAAARHMATVFSYAGRRFAPRPDAVVNARTGRKGGDAVSFTTEIAKRLGIGDAADEATVLAAVDELVGSAGHSGDGDGVGDDAVSRQGGDAVGDGGEAGDEVEHEDGAAVDGDGAGDGAGDEGAADGEGVGAAIDDDDVVTLDADVYADLLERAARGDAAEGDALRRKADELVSAAIKAGKVLAAKRESLVELAVEDYDAMKAKLDRLKPGIIPVSEAGRGGSDEARGADENGRMTRKRRAIVSGALRPAV